MNYEYYVSLDIENKLNDIKISNNNLDNKINNSMHIWSNKINSICDSLYNRSFIMNNDKSIFDSQILLLQNRLQVINEIASIKLKINDRNSRIVIVEKAALLFGLTGFSRTDNIQKKSHRIRTFYKENVRNLQLYSDYLIFLEVEILSKINETLYNIANIIKINKYLNK